MTTQVENPVTFDEISQRFVKHAAGYVANHYKRYLVTQEDCAQEIYLWLYSDAGMKYVEKRLEHEPQQLGRIKFKLRAIAKRYAERMKAEKVGYDPDDIHWYSATQIVALMPLVLDESFEGSGSPDYDSEKPRDDGPRAKKNPAELGDLTAMVLDIRRALDKLPDWVSTYLLFGAPGEDLYDSAVGAVLSVLGGQRDYVGKRRVMSNAEAQARASENYGG